MCGKHVLLGPWIGALYSQLRRSSLAPDNCPQKSSEFLFHSVPMSHVRSKGVLGLIKQTSKVLRLARVQRSDLTTAEL